MGAEIAGNSGHLSMAATRDNRLTAVTLGRLSLEEFFTRICLAVEDLEFEVARLRGGGVETRNDVLGFRACKLAFLLGPEGLCVELSQRQVPTKQ